MWGAAYRACRNMTVIAGLFHKPVSNWGDYVNNLFALC